jgi:hypothetical protein
MYEIILGRGSAIPERLRNSALHNKYQHNTLIVIDDVNNKITRFYAQ